MTVFAVMFRDTFMVIWWTYHYMLKMQILLAEFVYRFVWVGVRDWSWHYASQCISVFHAAMWENNWKTVTHAPSRKHIFLLQSHIRGFFLLWCPSQGQNWNKYKLFEHKGDTFVPDIWIHSGKDDTINWKFK